MSRVLLTRPSVARPSASCLCHARQVIYLASPLIQSLAHDLRGISGLSLAAETSGTYASPACLHSFTQQHSLCHSIIEHNACHAGLPVHINGYFELSSNRRNIWHSSLSSESSGAGKQKSDWNIVLLEVLHQVTSCSMLSSVRHNLHIVRQYLSASDCADFHRRLCRKETGNIGWGH